MNEDNITLKKTYAFALRIVKLRQYLCREKREWCISKQVFRSGTSIGANVEEASGGQSTKDFISKISIAYKECRETHYWLRLLHDSGYLEDPEFESIISDCEEIKKILSSILLTMKNKPEPSSPKS